MFQIRIQPMSSSSMAATAEDVEEEAKVEDDTHTLVNDEDVTTAGGATFLTGNPQVQVSTGKLRFYRPDRPYVNGGSPAAHALHALPQERNTLLCIVSVPEHMSPVELLEFLAGFRADIQLVRILKDPTRSNCMALLQFDSQERADQFFLAHNGTYFNSIEQERCKIVFVKSIEFDDVNEATSELDEEKAATATDASGDDHDHEETSRPLPRSLYPLPPPGMTEIPACAVCLDRLDASASGILTTLCNHTFHCDCLFRWEGSSCPVCRYSHGDIGSACEVCQTTEHLWICLICGHVGCGRYSGEHAKQHYHETMHTYSLELETQRVWDYAGDGFVHRLILNKQDGKFVEFPNPQTSSGERSQVPPPTDAEIEAGEHQKLEKLAQEYNFLLKSQLEEQRLFYERRLASLHESDHQRVISSLETDKKALKKANDTLGEKTKKLEEELRFVRELNKSLIENQKQWKERVRTLEDSNKRIEGETTQRIADLEAQVRDLMFYLDTQSKVERSAHREDIQGGSIQIEARPTRVTDSATSSTSGVRRTTKKKK